MRCMAPQGSPSMPEEIKEPVMAELARELEALVQRLAPKATRPIKITVELHPSPGFELRITHAA